MTLRPCLTCGTPSDGPRCDEHRTGRKPSARARGYDAAWDRLSRRARRLSPFCEICGDVEGLQTDHLPSAWQRRAEGKTIRLADVRVLCGPCNRDAGAARGNAATRGDAPGHRHQDPRPSPDFPLSARGRPL